MSMQIKSVKMSRADLVPLLKAEVEKWSARTMEDLRKALGKGPYTDALSKSHFHVEVDLLEDSDDYIHVSVAVCHPDVPWSCMHPLSRSFIVHRDGRVDK
jgi:hypothetical protein